MSSQRTVSRSGTRVHTQHCFVEGKPRHSCTLQVEWIWWRMSTKISVALAITHRSFDLLLEFKESSSDSRKLYVDRALLGTLFPWGTENGKSLGPTCLNNTV